MIEESPAQPAEIGPHPRLDGWRLGRILLTIGGALALLAFYAPWERATYFDSGAPGNQQVRDLAFATIFTRFLRPGASFYGVYTGGSLVASVTRDLVNMIPALLGLLLAMLLWLRLRRLPRLMVLAVSTLVLLCAGVVAVEYLRAILAVQARSMRGLADASHIGSIRILQGPMYAYPSTTFAWGYFLLVAALLVWAAGLALVITALRRNNQAARESRDSPIGARPVAWRDQGVVAALLGLGVAAWTIGVNYLPWLIFTCPAGIANNIHSVCVGGSVTGNVVYTVIAKLPALSQSYPQIYSQRLISPSILNVGNVVVFGSLVSCTFIALVGLGATICALLMRERRTWGYWAYLGFVAVISTVTFARTKTVFDDAKIGRYSLGVGMLVTLAGPLLIGSAPVLLQWRGPAPRERTPAD